MGGQPRARPPRQAGGAAAASASPWTCAAAPGPASTAAGRSSATMLLERPSGCALARPFAESPSPALTQCGVCVCSWGVGAAPVLRSISVGLGCGGARLRSTPSQRTCSRQPRNMGQRHSPVAAPAFHAHQCTHPSTHACTDTHMHGAPASPLCMLNTSARTHARLHPGAAQCTCACTQSHTGTHTHTHLHATLPHTHRATAARRSLPPRCHPCSRRS